MNKSPLLLLLLISLLFSACNIQKEENKTVILNGQIQNPNSEWVIFRVSGLSGDLISDTATLSEDGNFTTSFDIPDCRPVTLYDGKETSQMYVCPGDSIHITLNTEEFDESIYYEGKGAKKNNILAEYYLKFKDTENSEKVNFYAIRDTSIDVFLELVDKNADVASDYYEQLIASGNLSAEFLSFLNTDMHFDKILNMQYVYYSKNKDTTEEYKSKLNRISELTLDAANYQDADVLNQRYQTWLSYYVGNQIRRQIFREFGETDKNEYDSIYYDRLQNILSPEQMEIYLINEADNLSYSYNVDKFEKLFPMVDKYVVNPEYKNAIKAQYDEVVRKVNQPLPDDAFLFNLDDEELLELTFDDVLAKFKGNVIYLDFWASWCGPCKAEMPNSAKLAEKLKDEDVVFLYTSTDRDADAWERMIRIMQLHGLHYRLGKNTRKPVFEEFGIRYIPHYVLFDKEGNMVKNNMSRPGDVETEKIIRELL